MAKIKLVSDINSMMETEYDRLKSSQETRFNEIKKTVKENIIKAQNKQEYKDALDKWGAEMGTTIGQQTTDTITTATGAITGLDFETQTKIGQGVLSVDMGKIVNQLIDNQIDSMVKDQVKKARAAYNDSSINRAMETAEAYYKKALNSEKLLSEMRDDYTKALNKSISNKITSAFDKLAIGGKWGQLILPTSLIGKQVANVITSSVQLLINSVAGHKVIANVSKDIVDTVNRLKKAATDQFKNAFSNQIDYAKKLKKAIVDKIEMYNKLKEKYIAKMQAYVNKLQQAITDQIKRIEQAMINEITKFIQLNVSKMVGGLGGI